ncbi:PF10004 family protein [Capnocytophaga ochracea str. Holt 25]|nr:PF10004 family protein [Capnocytophaga ochracea str. Holt 25]
MSSELSDENLLNLIRKVYPDSIWEEINEDLYERQIEISKNYYLFWAVEKLSEIVALDKDKKNKLYEVDMIYSEFDWPIEWHHFIYYMPPKKGEKIGIDALYDDLIEYIDNSMKQLKETKTIELKKI